VRALTGTDPDRLKEEKARGITIDLGFAHTVIDGINFAFVDVPGHERFVKNMLAGVGGIDLVVLVVAADESVMPQTREHFDICRLLHVRTGVIALTKVDLADPDLIELARLETRELVAGSFLDGARIVPVSARDGTGLDALRAALVEAAGRVPSRTADGVTRLPIDRVFSMKGFGTVITGTLVSGSIATDQEVAILPGGRTVKVRGVQVHQQREPHAVAGQRAAVNLTGVEVHDVARGQSLVTPGAFDETRVADASVELLPGAKPLRHGARVRFHQGTSEIIGRIGVIGPDTTVVGPDEPGFIRLRLESPTVVSRGDRYILRAYSPPLTIGGGSIVDPLPPRTRIRAAAALARCRALSAGDVARDARSEERAAAALIADAGDAGLHTTALGRRVGVDPRSLDARVRDLVARGDAAVAGDILVTPAIVDRIAAAILAVLADHHRAQPLSDGVPREELRVQVFRRGHPAVYDLALTRLAADGRIALRDRVALAQHRLALSPDEERARDRIERTFREAGLTPPDAGSLATSLGMAIDVTDRVVKLLQKQKVLVRVDALMFHDEVLKKLKSDVASLKRADGPARIDVGTFKERFGVTRKFAIPLLEYLDRERVTRRSGDSRIVL